MYTAMRVDVTVACQCILGTMSFEFSVGVWCLAGAAPKGRASFA